MQTSLERRERRRRNGNRARRRGGSGAARGVAIALPLFLMVTLVMTGFVSFVGVIEAYSYYSRDLDDPRQLLEALDYSQQTVLYDRTGKVELTRFGAEERRLLTFSQVPNTVLDATTSTEDKTFWTNTGFDPAGSISAIVDGLRGKPRGGSTITQQLVRTSLLPAVPMTTADRKIKEIIQSIRLTEEYPGRTGKEAIITAYLNLNFYGYQSYGVAAAALRYFGVSDLNQLTIAQSAILSAILKAPTDYDLMANATEQDDGTYVVPSDSLIVQRRNWVLDQMRENNDAHLLLGKYDDAAIEAAKKDPVVLHPPATTQAIAPQFDLQVRQELAQLLCGQGVAPDDCQRIDTAGYKVVTTLDAKMQASAEKWLKAYIIGPNQGSKQATIDYISKLGITAQNDSFDYLRIVGPTPGTGAAQGLRDRNIHNGALIAVDYRNGQVLTYAGSAGFYEKTVKNPKGTGNLFDPQFDVLSDGWRQPGSSFKPINYSVGLDDKKMTAATMFMDVATDFGGGYTPHDADGGQRGPVRMRTAIQQSLNIPAIKAASINGVDHLMKRAQDFGLEFQKNANPGVSIGIGTVEVHPADLVSAYGAIANGGVLQQRTTILSITDSKGNQIWPTTGSTGPAGTRVISPQAAYVMTSILDSNTDPAQNFWWGQYELTSGKTRRPATLKTGTSDQTEDLFAGGWAAPPSKDSPNTPAIAAMVWAGNSDRTAGKGTMSLELAAPIWRDFMMDATAGTPVTNFAQPNGVTWKVIDGNSGLVPGPFTTYTYKEVFISGTEPTQVDYTKIPLDVDTASGKLWVDGCVGPKATQGFLDLSRVDAANPSWQQADAAWIARARQGQASKIYANGWGAPFAPDPANPANFCTPAPAPTPTPGPGDTPIPGDSAGPLPTATAPPQAVSPTPKPKH